MAHAIEDGAVADGVTSFDFLAGGTMQACRGWLSKEQVLDTRSLRELRRLRRNTVPGLS